MSGSTASSGLCLFWTFWIDSMMCVLKHFARRTSLIKLPQATKDGSVIIHPSRTFEPDSCVNAEELVHSVSFRPECCTQPTPSVILSTQIYLWQINREPEWWTPTQSWLVACLPHSSATNWPICQSSGAMIFMCLRLCIVYHRSSSDPCSCLSFTIIIFRSPPGRLPASFSTPTPSWIISPPPSLANCKVDNLHSLLPFSPRLPSLAACLDLNPNESFTFPLCLQ